MKKIAFLKILLSVWVSIAVYTPSSAAELLDGWHPKWRCGQETKLTKEFLATISPTHVFETTEKLPAFVVGLMKNSPPETDGFWDDPLILFAKAGSSWKAFPLESHIGAIDVLAEPGSGRALIFAMESHEAPMQYYTAVSTIDGFKTIRCGVLPAPDISMTYNEFMEITSFEKEKDGAGKLYGIVRRLPPEKSIWLEAITKDDGLTWTAPVPTSRQLYTDIPASYYPFELPDDLKKAAQ